MKVKNIQEFIKLLNTGVDGEFKEGDIAEFSNLKTMHDHDLEDYLRKRKQSGIEDQIDGDLQWIAKALTFFMERGYLEDPSDTEVQSYLASVIKDRDNYRNLWQQSQRLKRELIKKYDLPISTVILDDASSSKIHTTIGLYSNGEYKTNGVLPEDLKGHIDYNIKMRPGRALFVDGECKHKGQLSDEEIEEFKLVIAENNLKQKKCTKPYV